jgi:HK97 family phage major capsid protein
VRQTDQLLARYGSEIEEKQSFIDSLVEGAEKESRDLTTQEMELVTRTRDRLSSLNEQIGPLQEARRISSESANHVAAMHQQMQAANGDRPKEHSYRSAGAYVLDYWKAALGAHDAHERLDLYQRAAAHQTTTDNPGLLPEQLIAPVVNFVDESRPLVGALGARDLPAGSWSRPRITQHTQVQPQSAEKAELVSRKMIIGKVPVAAVTYGGYVNVSRQDADWTQPAIMDLIISDLAGQYAIETENAAIDALVAASTAGPTIATGAPTAAAVATAFWTAAGSVFAATKGQGRVIAVCGVDMLGMLGPLFVPINPQNAQSEGFRAVDFSTGLVGSIAGIPVYVTAGAATNTILVLSTAAAEVYEDRVGALQVVEPSVLGVQVAYAGYFAPLALEATGIIKITKTP